MAFDTKKQWLQQQLSATKELLQMSEDSILMKMSLESRIAELEEEINAIEDEGLTTETKISLWFSGDATYGSKGLKGAFMKETITSVEGMIRSATAQRIRECEARNHQRVQKPKGNYYVTALTNGSFGYEMSYIEDGLLFADPLIADSIADVTQVIERTANEGEDIDQMVEEYPIKMMSHLKDFYTTINRNNSFLRMESGNMGVTLDRGKTTIGYNNLCTTETSEREDVIEGVFQGALIDSGKFECTDAEGKLKHGKISEDVEADAIAEMIRQYVGQNCRMHIVRHLASYANGKKRETIELLSIEPQEAPSNSEG